VRLVLPRQYFEAISSRPLLLHRVATQTRRAGRRCLTITSTQAKQPAVQAVLTRLAGFLRSLKAIAEQLTDTQRLCAILARAFVKFMLAAADPPGLLTVNGTQSESSTALFRLIACLLKRELTILLPEDESEKGCGSWQNARQATGKIGLNEEKRARRGRLLIAEVLLTTSRGNTIETRASRLR
jgi:hypothetical protein